MGVPKGVKFFVKITYCAFSCESGFPFIPHDANTKPKCDVVCWKDLAVH